MQFDLIQCTVTLNQKGETKFTTIVRAGPDAITPPQAMILMNMHPPAGGTDDPNQFTLKEIVVVGTVERHVSEERARLRQEYGAAWVNSILPNGLRLPQKIGDLDIPAEAFAKVASTGPITIDPKSKMDIATKLFEAGVTIPDGATDDDIAALARENKIKVKEAA